MESFTPSSALLGGLLIGLSSSLLLFGLGRIAGISGIVAGALFDVKVPWRRSFLAGLIGMGVLLAYFSPSSFAIAHASSPVTIVVAGLLVGVGTRLGAGCTSGHGVCGLPRFSGRSAVAVATFIATGIVTVTSMRVLGAFS